MAKDWTALLESILPHPCRDRPLVCDGLPDASQVMIIGENPATDFDADWDWWHYWHPQTGFDYDRFIDDYKKSRKKKGKKRMFSTTRSRLNRIRDFGVRAVETNVYQNQQPGGAGVGRRNDRLLDLLVRNMSDLRAIWAHGDHAKDFVNEAKLPKEVKVLRTPHFASRGGFCNADVDKICREITSLPRRRKPT